MSDASPELTDIVELLPSGSMAESQWHARPGRGGLHMSWNEATRRVHPAPTRTEAADPLVP